MERAFETFKRVIARQRKQTFISRLQAPYSTHALFVSRLSVAEQSANLVGQTKAAQRTVEFATPLMVCADSRKFFERDDWRPDTTKNASRPSTRQTVLQQVQGTDVIVREFPWKTSRWPERR